MPEIKHNFTGGKMNKDLDERIVPNGEYRDAMNIQVSTSEGSDVGTVQNLLGNSLIPGQAFIGQNAKCIGSIADEKNDKLYWFILGNIPEHNNTSLENGDFEDTTTTTYSTWSNSLVNEDEWILVADTNPSLQEHGMAIVGGVLTRDDSHNGSNSSARQLLDIVEGVEYVMSYDRKYTGGSATQTNWYMDWGDGNQNLGVSTEDSGNWVTVVDSFIALSTGTMQLRIFFTGDMEGEIDNITITSPSQTARIIEYNSKTNTVIPVVVDYRNTVLKLNPDNLITGINIIDDMLFWTDNNSEPKKINIPRSIEGTDSSGLTHTQFINEKTDFEGNLKEEHITVIKKQPQSAPEIKLVAERDPLLTYAGVMRITSPPEPPTLPRGEIGNPGGNNSITNDQNTSSMWIDANSWANHHYDFSKLKLGDNFDAQIETNIAGESGFNLAWNVGDVLVLKAFEGENYDEAPSIPLTSYNVKAEIIASNTYYPTGIFSDDNTKIGNNDSFETTNSNGNFPYSWSGYTTTTNSTGEFYKEYDAVNSAINYNNDSTTISTYGTIANTNIQDWEVGAKYKVKLKISNWVSGKYTVKLVCPRTMFNSSATSLDPNPYFQGPGNTSSPGYYSNNGEYEFEVDMTTEQYVNNNALLASHTWNWNSYKNKTIGFHPGGANNVLVNDFTIDYIKVERLDVSNAIVRCEVLGFDEVPPVVPGEIDEIRYAVDKLDIEDKIFEFKFPRISYRYKYQDGEYSCVAPFSQVAFLPGGFDFHSKKGYNTGMSNRIKEIEVSKFMQNAPDGVIEVDILYKEDTSPIIYIADTIKPSHGPVGTYVNNFWTEDKYTISSEQISRAIESNQLLRPWDNVPKKALAQEVTGNRIVYGNYTHGYDLKLPDGSDYYPNFQVRLKSSDIKSVTQPSIKSLRDYQVGAVFVDEHGRETPVISNQTGTMKTLKEDASKSNKIQVGFLETDSPIDEDGGGELKYVKFFVKETSGQYYNIAMDRYYNAEDGQVWLSFPSSERNKIEVDDYLILKKGVNTNSLVQEEAKYKVLDIKSEAPEFITRDMLKIEEITHKAGDANKDLFGSNMVEAPIKGVKSFKVKYKPFSQGSSSNFQDYQEDLYIEFENTASNKSSKIYKLSSVNHDYDPQATNGVSLANARYTFRVPYDFDDGINFISDDTSGNNPSKILDGISLSVFKQKPAKDAKFDGKFFVKIDTDPTVQSKVIIPSKTIPSNPTYRAIASKKIHLMSPQHYTLHKEELMWGGNAVGRYGSGQEFGRMAPYFRNYKFPNDHVEYMSVDNNFDDTGQINIGRYKFGANIGSNSGWLKELAWLTTGGKYIKRTNSQYALNYNTGATFPGGNDKATANIRVGDAQAETKQERNDNATWFINKGPRRGQRTATAQYAYNFHYSWTYKKNSFSSGVYEKNDAIGSTDTGAFEFGVGPLWVDTELNPSDGIANFWNVGDLANTSWDSQSTIDFVDKIKSPGVKFRWEKDPTREVYTIQKFAGYAGIFHGDVPTDPVNTTRLDKDYAFDLFEEDGTPMTTNNDYSDDEGNYSRNTHLLAPLWTSRLIPYWLNSDEGTDLKWDPTKALGIIDGGLELKLDAHASQPTGTSMATLQDNAYVNVPTLSATNHDGTIHTIEVGMVLTSHSDGVHTLRGNPLTGGDAPLVVWKIVKISGSKWRVHLCGYARPLISRTVNVDNVVQGSGATGSGTSLYTKHEIFTNATDIIASQELVFQQPTMNGYTQYSCNRINREMEELVSTDTDIVTLPRIIPIAYNLEFVEEIIGEETLPTNPAIWETEPKENTPLDIYYEASGYNPLVLNEETKNLVLPIGSAVEHVANKSSIVDGTTIASVGLDTFNDPMQYPAESGWYITVAVPDAASPNLPLTGGPYINVETLLRITKPDGSAITVKVTGWGTPDSNDRVSKIYINEDLYGPHTKYTLNWHNCYSFGNGVESNRIRDGFNQPFIANGVKVSTTLPSDVYGEEQRKYGLIYSGIYNSNSGINNLNQFIAAEKITKDINPIYGSIQKIHSRDTDLIALCEDKVLRILANKDAVYNADGNPQLTANQNVLGQTVPFVGEFGISTNPESFVSESYRAYFTDRVRGAVMRLSKDGLTPISEHGMRDWFRDNLSLGITNLLGENNLDSEDNWNISITANSAVINGEAILGYYNNDIHDIRYGKVAQLRMDNVLEIGKRYRLQYDVVEHSGLQWQGGSSVDGQAITVVNMAPGSEWISGAHGGVISQTNGGHVNAEWVANRTDFQLLQYQVNTPSGYYTPPGETQDTVQNYVNAQRIAAGWPDTNSNDIPDNNGYSNSNWLYGGIVKIKNLIVEEVKEDLTLVGSYDDKKDEYNLTIHGTTPNTITFKEDVKGWASFKSFIPENALSCASDYYTVKDGKLWQHHSSGANRNTFYNEYNNSTVNVLLNDIPSTVKSFHALDYEGSQSRVEGIKTVEVTGIEHTGGSGHDGRYCFFEKESMSKVIGNHDLDSWHGTFVNTKQYRNNILIHSGSMKIYNDPTLNSGTASPSGGPTKGHGRYEPYSESDPGNWQVGDVITTEQQEKTVNNFNSMPKDGWYVSNIETDQDKGNLLEFIKKENKYYNYIKGLDLEIHDKTDFGSFDIQGLGIVSEIDGNKVYIDGDINLSLQVDDKIYFERPSEVLGDDIVDTSKNTNIFSGTFYLPGFPNTPITYGFEIIDINTVDWNIATTNFIGSSVRYMNNIMDSDNIVEGKKYRLTLEVSNYNGTGSLGVAPSGGVSSSARRTSNGTYTEDFTATGSRLDFFGRDTNAGTMKLTVRELMIGEVFGFTRLESNNLQEIGSVSQIGPEHNVFEIANANVLETNDYVMFVKNQVINTSGISGYYADAKFENNSKTKAEIFAVSSEITESSK